MPVLLVKNRRSYHRSPILAAVDPRPMYGATINLDEDLLSYGSTIAAALSADLHAVHACSPIPGITPSGLPSSAGVSNAPNAPAARARTALRPLLSDIPVPEAHRYVTEGFPAEVIERCARDIDAQIVIMRALSRSELQGLLVGSTAEQLLDQMPRDLLIVKPRDFKYRIPSTERGAQFHGFSGVFCR